jgi:galactokinase
MDIMDITAAFTNHFHQPPVLIARAPGRVNLLGEHVDYNSGPVLPAAIDRSVRLVVAPSAGSLVDLFAFALADLQKKVDIRGRPLPGWALYPAGVAWSLQEAGFALPGLLGLYTSDVPIASGLSSSAAVELAFAVAWQALSGFQADRMTLARLAQKAENHYAGVSCGLMDQFASAHGVAGHAVYFDTRDLSFEPVPLPAGTALVIADSNVPRSLAGSEYNERRSACEQAVTLLRQYLPQISSLRDVSPQEFAAYGDFLPDTIRKRAEHVVKEIARVFSAVTALRSGERRAFGALMYAGHASLRDLYEVSTPQLDTLVEIARDLPGCYGARLTGAGFGGCTINLVEAAQAEAFVAGLETAYTRRSGREARVYVCQASDGANFARL